MTLRHRAPSLARLVGLVASAALLAACGQGGDQAPSQKVVAPASADVAAPMPAEPGPAAKVAEAAKPAPAPAPAPAPQPPAAATVNKLAPVPHKATVKLAKPAVEGKPAESEIPFEGKRIDVIHTANLIGEIEPCG